MSTAAPVKTGSRTLAAWQSVATANFIEGSPLDVSGMFSAWVTVQLGREASTAFTAGSPNIRIEGTPTASGDLYWSPMIIFQPLVGASIAATTLSAAILPNDATFTVASASNITAGDLLYLGDSTVGNSELVRVKSVASTTITPVRNIVNSHSSGARCSDQAEQFSAFLDLSAVMRIRAVIDNITSGQTIYATVVCSTHDSVDWV